MIFRQPIICRNVPRLVPGWTQPIVVGRHAFGDQYRATDFRFPGAGKLTMKFVGDDGTVIERDVYDAPSSGVYMGMYNLDDSIIDFARASLNYGLNLGWPVYLSTKNTILKAYDGRFKDLFQKVYEEEFEEAFKKKGIHYEHRLIDDMVACAHEMVGRLCLGLQELRRRRAVGHRGAGLRQPRPDDIRPDDARWQDGRGRGGAWHGHAPLPPAPEGPADLDQLGRLDLRLDRRAEAPRQAGRQRGADALCRDAGEGDGARRSRMAT